MPNVLVENLHITANKEIEKRNFFWEKMGEKRKQNDAFFCRHGLS